MATRRAEHVGEEPARAVDDRGLLHRSPARDATKPSTVSTRSMRSRSPSSACSTDSAFSAHHRAASVPSSTVRSSPRTPGFTSTPSWLRGQLTRRARPAAVHDDRVERIVRRERAGQRQAQLGESLRSS